MRAARPIAVWLAALAVATAPLAGCGGSKKKAAPPETPKQQAKRDPEKDPKGAAEAAYAWGRAATPKAMCALMTASFRKNVAGGKAKGCAKRVRKAVGPPPKAKEIAVDKVELHGSTAIVTAHYDGKERRLVMSFVDGRWLVNSL